ncbi:hypothetical protein JCM15764A_36640 [Geotalea toluenoxydans]
MGTSKRVASKVIAPKVDRFINVSQIGNDKLLLIYQKNKIGYSATYSIAGFSLLDLKELPKTQYVNSPEV